MINNGLMYFAITSVGKRIKDKYENLEDIIERMISEKYDINIFKERISKLEDEYHHLLDISDCEINSDSKDESFEKYLSAARDLYMNIGVLKTDLLGYQTACDMQKEKNKELVSLSFDKLKSTIGEENKEALIDLAWNINNAIGETIINICKEEIK